MDRITADEMLKWVVYYTYRETIQGIGTCEAVISVREEAERLKFTFEKMDRAEKKEIMCALIDKVGHPCEGYADDYDDESSAFGFKCMWNDEIAAIHFCATFRV